MRVIALWIQIYREVGGSESRGAELCVAQVRGSPLTSRRGLTANGCCKSAQANRAVPARLPAVPVAKMTDQPSRERGAREAGCGVEMGCCWGCGRLRAPRRSAPADGTVLGAVCGGGMPWAPGRLPEAPELVRHPTFGTARKPGGSHNSDFSFSNCLACTMCFWVSKVAFFLFFLNTNS